jgi:hypothetical protein
LTANRAFGGAIEATDGGDGVVSVGIDGARLDELTALCLVPFRASGRSIAAAAAVTPRSTATASVRTPSAHAGATEILAGASAPGAGSLRTARAI